MIQFNPDGSLKIPASALEKKWETAERLKNSKCIKIRKEVVNFDTPKKCVLHVTISDKITDTRFIETIHKYFKEDAETPTKVIKISEKEFDIEIGTSFRRCTECTTLINRYREFLDDNLIEEKGNCTYEGFGNQKFTYEDYFE